MARLSKDNITQVVLESRRNQVTSGVKQGLLRGSVDKMLEQLAEPLAERACAKLHELHPGTHIADMAVRGFVEFALLSAMAEVMEFGGPAMSKLPGVKMTPGEAKEKGKALANWMRTYAGEKLGENVVGAIATLAPIVSDLVSDIDLSSLAEQVSSEETLSIPALENA